MLRFPLVVSVLSIFRAATVGAADLDCLALSAAPYDTHLIERVPLIFKLTLANTCDDPVDIYYGPKALILMEKWATLHVTDEEGRSHELSYFGGRVQARYRVPIPTPLKPGDAIERDCIRSLLIREPPPPRWAGDLRGLLEPLPAGRYRAHVELPHLRGAKIVSNEFDITVVQAQGVDANAGHRIGKEHFDFFEGRDHPSDVDFYDGRKWWKKVDVSRFGQIQEILDDYPDSTYADWIRFWKVYHHGRVEEGLRYARAHPDFPLSDNLFLRKVEGLVNKAGKRDFDTLRQVQTLVDELLRDFPEGDTRAAAVELKARVVRKLAPDSDRSRPGP